MRLDRLSGGVGAASQWGRQENPIPTAAIVLINLWLYRRQTRDNFVDIVYEEEPEPVIRQLNLS